MIKYILKRDRFIFAFSAVALLIGQVFLPDAPGPRSWCLVAASFALPLCIVGRTFQRARDNWLSASRRSAQRINFLLAEQLPILLLLALFSGLGGQGAWRATCALFVWGTAVFWVADAADRWLVTPARVWGALVLVGLAVMLAPLYLAPWFGRTALSPELSTYAIGVHPIGLILSAFGEPTLQDPLLYRVSLSGVVEVRPLTWTHGLVFYVAVSLVALWGSISAERRHHVYDFQVLR